MPAPTSSTTVNRPELAELAYEYMQAASRSKFIGLQALPLFETGEKNGEYPVVPLEALLKIPDTARGPGGTYNRGDWEFELQNYNCEEHGWEEPLFDDVARLYRRFFDAEMVAVQRAVDIILRGQEKRVADLLFNATTFSGFTGDVGTEWDTSATCTPRADVNTAKGAVEDRTGLVANTVIMARKVFENVIMSTEFKEWTTYTNSVVLETLEAQRRLLAMYFGVNQVLIGNAVYDSANKGQSFTSAQIWDDEYCLVCVCASNPNDLREPCIGRTFLWTTDSPSNMVVEEYREEQTRSNVYRCRQSTDEVMVFAGAGYLLSNITT